MGVGSTASAPTKASVDEVLSYLPRRNSVSFARNQVIFGDGHRPEGLYLLLEGRIKLTSALEVGPQTVIDIYGAGEFFGESGLVGTGVDGQTATSIESAEVMYWSSSEVREHMEKHPHLGLALVQLMVRRCAAIKERLQSLAVEDTGSRVARSLLRFADRFGVPQPDGSNRIPPLTHQLLSEYVGTSRELVTFHMNDLRRQGYLDYSRSSIDVHADRLRTYLSAANHGRSSAGIGGA